MEIWGRVFQGRRDSECKSPEAEIHLLCSRVGKPGRPLPLSGGRGGGGQYEQGDLRGSGDIGRD